MQEHVPVIVVGVDGSAGARAALAHAMADAARRGARVRAVRAFEQPEYWAEAYGLSAPPAMAELTAKVEAELRGTVDEVVTETGPAVATVPVEVVGVGGPAAGVLVEQAAGADALVVGHRGRGGFASMLLGSVGLQCVLHAPCPVTVVRPVLATATSDPGATERTEAPRGVQVPTFPPY